MPAASKRAAKKPTKRKTTVKAPAKKNGAVKAVAKKRNGKSKIPDKGPLDLVITDETLRFKLQAADLLFSRENDRLNAELQARVNEMIERSQRNDMAWKKVAKHRKDVVNEVIKLYTDNLPEGYAVKNVNPEKGTYTAVYNPEIRGQLIK